MDKLPKRVLLAVAVASASALVHVLESESAETPIRESVKPCESPTDTLARVGMKCNEKALHLTFHRVIDGKVDDVKLNLWAVTLIDRSLRRGNLSLCNEFGIDPELFALTLRNAGVLCRPDTESPRLSGMYPDFLPGVSYAN